MSNTATTVSDRDPTPWSRPGQPSTGSSVGHNLPGALIETNDRVYSWLVDRAHKLHRATRSEADAERTLLSIQKAAAFAAAYHTGRFVDANLENIAIEIADRWLPTRARIASRPGERRRILHVASQFPTIGGHTKCLAQWIKYDPHSQHSIALTTPDAPLSESLAAYSKRSGGHISRFRSNQTLIGRAKLLRGLASEADLIVLHHDGHDLVPIIAFADSELPPVAIVNHADHLFWLGSSSCDVLINLRRCSSRDNARRQVRNTFVLPIPLEENPSRQRREVARCSLGVDEKVLLLLAVARGVKFRPSGSFDFMATAHKVLERNPTARLFVVGETLDGLKPFLRDPVHERIHFVGPLDDLQVYRDASDVHLETFPFGSQTALLESALAGLPVVRAYAPLTPLLVANDDAIDGLAAVPSGEEQFIDEATRLCVDERSRRALGRNLQDRTSALHTGAEWSERLNNFYALASKLTHTTNRLDGRAPETSADDLALAEWQAIRDGRGTWNAGTTPDDLAIARHTASIARYADHMLLARWKALQSVWMAPFAWTSWRLLAATLLGGLAHQARAVMARARHG